LRIGAYAAALGACCALWAGLIACAPGHAQTPPPAAVDWDRGGALDPQKRAELQRLLDQHVQVLESQALVLKTVAKLLGPTVVHVEADVPQQASLPMGRGRHVEEAGSGVIIQFKGKYYVLTNRHVIRDATPDAIRINLADGRRLQPAQVWGDPETDVAVLRVEGQKLVSAPIGDSDRMEIGDFVLAAGSPFGLSHSITFGIISAKGRRDLRLSGDNNVHFQDFLQTDAAINPGNSGGPLCNLRGEVIGINTAIASNSGGNEGIGFAIPVKMFMFVARQLIESGKVTRAFLGVSLDSKFGAAMAAEVGLPCPMGARIIAISKGSPAEAAHLQVGDVILEVDGTRIEDDGHLVNLVSLMEIGKRIPVLVFRDGKSLTITLEVADRSRFGQ
jgi:serine protease Do